MKTILLIDDDEEMRLSFGSVLRRSGYHVIEADSGLTGLAMARQHLPDLILSDIHMPGGDGSTLLRDLRADPELKSRQIVLMTGKPELITPRKGMEDGADDFLVKPVSMKALLGCVAARFERASISWRVEDQILAELRSSVPAQLPHECFTPLGGIIGLVEILSEDFQGLSANEIREILSDVHLSALRLHRTLRNYLLILDLQNISPQPLVGLLAPHQVEESIRAGVAEALRLNKRQADLIVRINACPISIKPGDLTRIVEELTDNACKFSRQGTPIEVEFTNDGSLLVTDHGRGLTDEQLSKIGAFTQFDRTKYEQQGLGLGLFLVQKLSALCHAKLTMSSQPGEGTEARVEFALTNGA